LTIEDEQKFVDAPVVEYGGGFQNSGDPSIKSRNAEKQQNQTDKPKSSI